MEHSQPATEDLLSKARNYCAKQERCTFDLQRAVQRWGGSSEQSDQVIEQMKEEEFLNDERYVEGFVSSRFHNRNWGRLKIRAKLQEKRLPEDLIEQAISRIEGDDYQETLRGIVRKELQKLGEPLTRKKKEKLIRRLASRGYELGAILKELE